MTRVPLVCLLLLACGSEAETTYADRVHDDSQDGAEHARDKSVPFLCADPETGDSQSCPTDERPDVDNLSCDASGCHGSFEYSADQDWSARALDGDEGPGCNSCHGSFWSDEM